MHTEQIETFARYINKLSNEIYNIEKIRMISRNDVAAVTDSPDKFFLPGLQDKDDAVVMLSKSGYPDFVERSVNNTLEARKLLKGKNRSTVSEPITYGRYLGLSFAVWPEHKPMSESKIIYAIQKRLIAESVFEWLRLAARDTLVGDLDETTIEEFIRKPLASIVQNPKHNCLVHKYAEAGLRSLNSKNWIPVTILQHSDFWLGNILFEKSKFRPVSKEYGFCIIDWSGALSNGAPIYDFIRFCRSANVKKQRAAKELLKYSGETQIPIEQLRFYLLVALGRIGLNLEQFPEDRFLEMCEKCVLYMDEL